MAARHLSIATCIEKNRIASPVAFIPLLEIKVKDPTTGNIIETLRFARNEEPITFEGNTFEAGAFDFDTRAAAGEAPTLTLTVVDYTKAVQARMQQYGGGVGFDVRVLIVNTGNLEAGAEIEELFSVTGARARDYEAIFTLGAENPLTMRFPRRRQFRDRCQWRYRDPDTCGYTGTMPTCDFTLDGPNGCKAHNNTLRFGGFPGLVSQN